MEKKLKIKILGVNSSGTFLYLCMDKFRQEVQETAIKIALENERCGLDLSIRIGKCFIGLSLAQKFNKVLVGYDNTPILTSWKEDSIKFNLNDSNITYTTYASLDKYNLNDFDLILLDELHTVSENNWNYIALNNPKRIVGMTGTMPEKGVKKQFIDTYCPIKYTIKLDETTNKTSKDYQIIVHLLEPSKVKDIKTKNGVWSDASKISFWERKYEATRSFTGAMLFLIQAIQNSPTKFNYLKQLSSKIDNGFIFVETSKQCEELGLPSYNSKEPNSEINLQDFKDGKIAKLSTINQLKAGITIFHLKQCIILHSYSSQQKSHQKLGRCLTINGDDKAIIHILCLKGTYDEKWVRSSLSQFDNNKILWKTI